MAEDKHGSFRLIMIVMFVSMFIALSWDKMPFLKSAVHYVLNPTVGALFNWNLNVGMIIVVLLISILTTLIQKYTTDQVELKNIKKNQKEIQKEMKQHRNNPQKTMELNKKNMELMPKQFKLMGRSMVYTSIPLLFLFRWFYDYFLTLESNKVLGMHWMLIYIVLTIIFSSIIKKKFDIA